MSGKPRVHVLAKELGVPVKQVLAWLAEEGEFVKSASHTVEPPVARRLREKYQPKDQRGDSGHGARAPASTNPLSTRLDGSAPSWPTKMAPEPQGLTPSQTAIVCSRFRRACADGRSQADIDRLYAECEARYGVSRHALRAVVAADFDSYPTEYVATRRVRTTSTGRNTGESASLTASANVGRPRQRTGVLVPRVDIADVESVVDLIVNIDASQVDRDDVRARVEGFIARDAGGYGYLAWRCGAAHRHAYRDSSPRTVHHDLAVMARVITAEKLLVEQISHAHGRVLERPALARRVLDAEFNELSDVDDIGRSAADELRHVRAAQQFLRLAVVLTIASPDCEQRLWNMLDQIRPPAPERLVETSTSLDSAIARLNDLVEDVETLLTVSEEPLGRFFDRARAELVALLAGRYDFLPQFHDLVSPVRGPRRATDELPFAVLPRGEQLRTFLAGLRSSGLYRGHQVDERRVTVLEEIEKHFGVNRCEWHEGAASFHGFDNHYVVLSIKGDDDSGDHAVAISPLAGEHATYIVRSDCTSANWMTVLAQSKSDAREQGAYKLLFTGSEPFDGMRAKVIDALECPPWEFLSRLRQRKKCRRQPS